MNEDIKRHVRAAAGHRAVGEDDEAELYEEYVSLATAVEDDPKDKDAQVALREFRRWLRTEREKV